MLHDVVTPVQMCLVFTHHSRPNAGCPFIRWEKLHSWFSKMEGGKERFPREVHVFCGMRTYKTQEIRRRLPLAVFDDDFLLSL